MLKYRMAVSAFAAMAVIGCVALAQEKGAPGQAKGKGGAKATRSPLFLREVWKDTPGGEHAVTSTSLGNPNLELKLYGPEADIQVTGASADENNPVHLWTGECPGPCGAALRDKTSYVDLTGLARIRWTHKMSGFHQIRPMVKLADGSWLVGDRTEGSPTDWLTTEFAIGDVRWIKLDEKRMVTTGTWVNNPDLTKVDEIGFADLFPGSGHGAGGWADVGLIEVYGKPVKR